VPALGAFTFVLHSHLPYVRFAGRWPHGEEWIHEAATETYIPLLQTLYDLKDDGVRFKLTLGITPVLAEQLNDPDVCDHLDQYLDDRINAAKRDIAYYDAPETADKHLRSLAEWYLTSFEQIKNAFDNRFHRNIVGAFRALQDEGYIELMVSAATHGYLPLLSRDSSINAQLKAGIANYRRLFGRDPSAVWLPECAYRPAYITESGRVRPGLEHFLAQNGLKVFFGETHTITGGQPVGVAAGDAIGPYGEIKRRYVVPASAVAPERPATTFMPYYVSDTTSGPTAGQHSGVTVIGRNNRTGQQVWSADWGYPGDFDYREFYRRAGTSGLQYWRITEAKIDLAVKDYYHPDWAAYKVDQHAEHFAHLVGDVLRAFNQQTGEFGIVSSNYDTELFGHWWYEGVAWLGKVLRHLAESPEVELTTASAFIAEHPPRQALHIPESSWGAGGTHFVWDNPETHWMWEPVYEAEARMARLAEAVPTPSDAEMEVLNQTARELLLLQSSDWPFLVTTGQAREYAIQRYSQHLERFDKLAASLEGGGPNVALARDYWELDKVFPDVDYRWFTENT
jgi:1,4-alpha-glucan branching enzyme